jgi:hypothetical protein
MGGRLLGLWAAICIACLLPGRGLADEGRLDQVEQRVKNLEQRLQRDAGTQFQLWNFVASGFAVLALAAFCALWARSTGRDPWLWLAAGLVFNIFALLAIWSKHEEDKKTAKVKVTESADPCEWPREGRPSSQNIRPARAN